MQCPISCSIIGEHNNKERVSNGVLIWLNHDIHMSEILMQISLELPTC
jgi:hypothetical protein